MYTKTKSSMTRPRFEQNYIIHIRLMKITGLYKLLDSKTPKLYGYNIFKLGSILTILYLMLINIMYCMSIYYSRYDFTEVVKYISIFVATFYSMIKLCYLIKNSDAFFELLSFASIHFFSYCAYTESALIKVRKTSKIVSNTFTFIWIAIIMVWMLSPIMMKNNYMNVKTHNGTYEQYRYNMLNIIFPVTTKFYNDNFFVFYAIESILLIIYGYVMVIYDFLVVSACITIIYQLKLIRSSYRKLGYDSTSTDFKSELY